VFAVTRALNCYGRVGRLLYSLSNGSGASGSAFQGVLSCFSFVFGRLYLCTGGTVMIHVFFLFRHCIFLQGTLHVYMVSDGIFFSSERCLSTP
jgi:hypothetical protein